MVEKAAQSIASVGESNRADSSLKGCRGHRLALGRHWMLGVDRTETLRDHWAVGNMGPMSGSGLGSGGHFRAVGCTAVLRILPATTVV